MEKVQLVDKQQDTSTVVEQTVEEVMVVAEDNVGQQPIHDGTTDSIVEQKLNSTLSDFEFSVVSIGTPRDPQLVILITGLSFPKQQRFGPLAKLWANTRKMVLACYGIDLVGLFAHQASSKTIECRFILNYALIDGKSPEDEQRYVSKYLAHAGMIAATWQGVIEEFILDEKHGFKRYCELAALDDGTEQYKAKVERMLDAFLRSIGMKYTKTKAKNPRESRPKPPKH